MLILLSSISLSPLKAQAVDTTQLPTNNFKAIASPFVLTGAFL
ncbi:MAG: hypothetical protein V7K25_14895 [Nostoc sp.]